MKSENDLNSTKLGSFTYEDKGISIQTFYLDVSNAFSLLNLNIFNFYKQFLETVCAFEFY